MPHIPQINIENTVSSHRALFDQIKATFGVVPNMFTTIGHSQAALESMWTSFGALSNGSLPAVLGEQIAVLVADMNRCEYCLAAHTALGQKAGATMESMAEAQAGISADPKTQAVLNFTRQVVNNRAAITKEDIDNLKEAGFTNEGVAEILAHIALNIFTNYTNVAFDVPLDFPKVSLNPVA